MAASDKSPPFPTVDRPKTSSNLILLKGASNFKSSGLNSS